MNLEDLNNGYVIKRGDKKRKQKIIIPRKHVFCLDCNKSLRGKKCVSYEKGGTVLHRLCFKCHEKSIRNNINNTGGSMDTDKSKVQEVSNVFKMLELIEQKDRMIAILQREIERLNRVIESRCQKNSEDFTELKEDVDKYDGVLYRNEV